MPEFILYEWILSKPLYKLTMTDKQTDGRTEKVTYWGMIYGCAQKVTMSKQNSWVSFVVICKSIFGTIFLISPNDILNQYIFFVTLRSNLNSVSKVRSDEWKVWISQWHLSMQYLSPFYSYCLFHLFLINFGQIF